MTIGSHQKTLGGSQDWITPRWIIDDGLTTPWHGRMWLNPPFDRYVVGKWISKLAAHGNGTALLHLRAEAGWFEPVGASSADVALMLAQALGI
jgi:hypothetical protein